MTATTRRILSHALFISTLGEAFAGLAVDERAALLAAAEAARAENPLDPALVEIVVMLTTADEAVPIH